MTSDQGASDQPARKDNFNTLAEGDAIRLECQAKASVIGIGRAYKISSYEVVAPEDNGDRFGLSNEGLKLLGEDNVPSFKARFIDEQTRRFQEARQKTIAAYGRRSEEAARNTIPEMAGDIEKIAETEHLMSQSNELEQGTLQLIEQGYTAEQASYKAYQMIAQVFRDMDDPYLAAKGETVEQILATIQCYLGGKAPPMMENVPEASILVCDSVSPADILTMLDHKSGRSRVSGIVCTSRAVSLMGHAAILAKSLGLPFVLMDKEDADRVGQGDDLIIDGRCNEVLIALRDNVRDEYKGVQKNSSKYVGVLDKKSREALAVQTRDGVAFNVFSNMELTLEGARVRAANPVGVGLYRSEIADGLRQAEALDVKGWYDVFHAAIKKAARSGGDGKVDYMPITFRTLDLAGDKSGRHVNKTPQEREEFQEKQTYMQIEALLRLRAELAKEGAGDKIKVMIPMIRGPEAMQGWQDFANAKAEEMGMPGLKLGAMAEIPALFSRLDDLDVDFISVGSNDLTAFELGLDRYGTGNGPAPRWSDSIDNDVLDRHEQAVAYGAAKDVPVSICGDMASDIRFLPVLVGLGYRNLSVGIDSVPLTKEVMRRIDTQEAAALVTHMRATHKRVDREKILHEFNAQRLGIQRDGTMNEKWSPPAEALDLKTLHSGFAGGEAPVADGGAS